MNYTQMFFSVFWNSDDLGEKAMATYSSTLAWKIPWTEEPGRLQSMGLLRVGYDWATSLSLSLSCIGGGTGNPLQCSCLENPRDDGAWWAAVYGVSQSRTRLKWLSTCHQWLKFLPAALLKFFLNEYFLTYNMRLWLELQGRQIKQSEDICISVMSLFLDVGIDFTVD